MILHWSLFKAGLVLAGMTILLFPQAKANFCNEKRDPLENDLIINDIKNALDSDFRFEFDNGNKVTIHVKNGTYDAGFLTYKGCVNQLEIYGYAKEGEDPTWPGKTFEVTKAVPHQVTWVNKIAPGPYILTGVNNGPIGNFSLHSVVDKSLHWSCSLGNKSKCSGGCNCSNPTFEGCGVPIVTHLHGGQTDFKKNGNPDFFFGLQVNKKLPLIRGPEYNTNIYRYANNLDATSIWYHNHSLGITRLNVYAGLARFYFVCNEYDTGLQDNPLKIPAFPHEVAFAIQDCCFRNNGKFLCPAFPGDPGYDDFITCQKVNLTNKPQFPHCGTVPTTDCNDDGEIDVLEGENCGPTALTEFFGDHMVVNGKIWPKMDVEPRHYRLRLLNGCNSQFLTVAFCIAGPSIQDPKDCESTDRIPFYVIGGDQGLASEATPVDMLLMKMGSRYDIIFDFSVSLYAGKRIIMKNFGGNVPFGGNLPGEPIPGFDFTDRIMAFDVVVGLPDYFNLTALNKTLGIIATARTTPRDTADFSGHLTLSARLHSLRAKMSLAGFNPF